MASIHGRTEDIRSYPLLSQRGLPWILNIMTVFDIIIAAYMALHIPVSICHCLFSNFVVSGADSAALPHNMTSP